MFLDTHNRRSVTALKIMSAVFLVLLALHLFHLYLFYSADITVRFLDFNREHNLPTLFATLNLCFSAYLLFTIGRSKARTDFRYAWLFLALIFLILAIDEYGMIHDGLSKKYRPYVEDIDYLYFAWVIPYGILLLVLGVVMLKFFFHLPNRFKILFGLSGFIFVLGAIGFEVIGASRAKNYPRSDYLYTLYSTIEECLEFIGIILFNYSLLSYIETDGKPGGVDGLRSGQAESGP